MKTWIAALTMVCALAAQAGTPGDGRDSGGMGRRPRSEGSGNETGRRLYAVRNLVSAGGTSSAGNGINDLGWVTGSSNLPGDTAAHASVWIQGFRADLGTLGGPNSNVAWPVKSDDGIISGIAETDELN